MYGDSLLLKNFLKFEEKTTKILESIGKKLELKEFYRIFNITRKRQIKNSVINLLYEEPEKFFVKNKNLLKDTSYYDISGNSIFAHYFNNLYKEFSNANKKK